VIHPPHWRDRGLFLAWSVALAVMLLGFFFDLNAERHGHIVQTVERSGMTAGAAMLNCLKASVVELLVLYAVLRPWSFTNRSWPRAGVALALFVPYGLLLLIVGPGGMLSIAAHGLWVWTISVALLCVTLFRSEGSAKAMGLATREDRASK